MLVNREELYKRIENFMDEWDEKNINVNILYSHYAK